MNVPEYIGKELLREGGIRTPRGSVAKDSQAAAKAAAEIGGRVAVKAQIPAGKRGKSGG
ncbi:MAG: ATP-grasp domain-containing protein, partial [Vulcanimicrobiaceae bacterium]